MRIAVAAAMLGLSLVLAGTRGLAADAATTARVMVDRVVRLAEAPDQRGLLALDDETVVSLSRNLRDLGLQDEQGRLFRSLASSPHFTALSPRIRSLTAIIVIRNDAATLTPASAAMLLDQVMELPVFLEFLALRRYASLWPATEARVGPGLEAAAADLVKRRESAWQPRRRDARTRLQLALARYLAADFSGVLDLARTIDHRPQGIARLEEDDAWTLETEARALDALGRTEEATQVMDLVGTLPRRGGNGWSISFRINRAARLLALGEWTAGLAASQAAVEALADGVASAYGRAEAYGLHACALLANGRGSEAAPYLDALDRGWASHPVAAAEALLCAGDRDRAARVVIAALAAPEWQATMAVALQEPAFLLRSSSGALPTLRPELLGRPDVATAFAAVARDIPPSFVPAVTAKRRPLPARAAYPGTAAHPPAEAADAAPAQLPLNRTVYCCPFAATGPAAMIRGR